MKRKAGYMKVEVNSAGSGRYICATRNLNSLKSLEGEDAKFRILGPCAAPDATLDIDGAYRRPAHYIF